MSEKGQPSLSTAKAMARIAGLSYVMYTLLGLYGSMGPAPGLWSLPIPLMPGTADEFLFRTVLVSETLLYVCVAISAAAMYACLRPVGPGIAVIGAFCRLVESAMGACFVAVRMIAFGFIVYRDEAAIFTDQERGAFVRIFSMVQGDALFFLLTFMSIGATLFFILFYRSRFIPRWLAAWGIFTYLQMSVLSIAIIVHPPFEEWVMVFFLPGAFFEMVVGLWLLFIGIRTTKWESLSHAR